MAQYSTVIKEINSLFNQLEKRADQATEAEAMKGTEGQGEDVDAGAESSEVKLDKKIGKNPKQPSTTDDGTKSTDYPADKSAKDADRLLKMIYDNLYKRAEDEEEEVDEEEAEETPEEEVAEHESGEEAPDEEEEEDEEVPSEKEVMASLDAKEKKELKGASLKKKAEYVKWKRYGYKIAQELNKDGTLQKMAFAQALPLIEEASSFEAGRMVAEMEKAGSFNGTSQEQLLEAAQVLAGGIIAEMEKNGSIKVIDPELTGTTMQKRASPAEAREIVKQAAAATTESIIHDLTKNEIGRNLNGKLKKLLNPQ